MVKIKHFHNYTITYRKQYCNSPIIIAVSVSKDEVNIFSLLYKQSIVLSPGSTPA